MLGDAAGELDRILQRELGAGADREMRSVGGIAHQHDRRLAFATAVVHPVLADNPRELDPLRGSAQVRGVGDEPVAIQVLRKQLLAVRDRLLLLHLVHAGLEPDGLGYLHDEGGGLLVEAVGMRLEPAVLGFLEGEGEGVEQLVGTEPDEAAVAHVDVGPEGVGVAGADAAVEPVARDHQVGVGIRLFVVHVGFENQFHAEFLAALLKDVQQPLAADAAKAMTARHDLLAANIDFDVVPMIEGVEDLRCSDRIRRLQVAEGLVGKHDPPTEGVVRSVALHDGDVVLRVGPLHQQGKVEAGGAAAEADDFHAHSIRLPHYSNLVDS